MITNYKLYGKLENKIIKEIQMSWQLKDLDGWTELKETKNRHESNNYNLKNFDGIYLLKFVSGKITDRTQSEIDKDMEPINKSKEIQAIDTGIAQGMTAGYDYNGSIISTSLPAQCNWNNVINRLNRGEDVDFPYPISLVNGGVVMIANEAEMYLLYNSASKTLETLHNGAIIARSELLK